MEEIKWPNETPCAGCGWPQYCCLCPDDDEQEQQEHDAWENTGRDILAML